MARAAQPARRNRSALSDIAVRLGLLALVSYPVFPSSGVSPVGTTRFDVVRPGATAESLAVPPGTATPGSCLSITATPGTPVVALTVTDERCGNGEAETGELADLDHAYHRSRLGREHRSGVARPSRSDVACDRTGALWWERGRPALR